MSQIAVHNGSFHRCLIDLNHQIALMSPANPVIDITFMSCHKIKAVSGFCHLHASTVEWITYFAAEQLRIAGDGCCSETFPVFVIFDDTDHFFGVTLLGVALCFCQIISILPCIKSTPDRQFQVQGTFAQKVKLCIIIFHPNFTAVIGYPHVPAVCNCHTDFVSKRHRQVIDCRRHSISCRIRHFLRHQDTCQNEQHTKNDLFSFFCCFFHAFSPFFPLADVFILPYFFFICSSVSISENSSSFLIST